MTFELVEKGQWVKSPLNPMQISIRKTLLRFGADLTRHLGSDMFVEVYLDRKNNLVGFKSTESSMTGFKLGAHNSQSDKRLSISGIFLKWLPTGVYEAKIEGDMIVVEVPGMVDNTETIKLE